MDFIQNGSIVATKKLEALHGNDYYHVTPPLILPKLILKEGEYQVSLRMDSSVQYVHGSFPMAFICIDDNKNGKIDNGEHNDLIFIENGNLQINPINNLQRNTINIESGNNYIIELFHEY